MEPNAQQSQIQYRPLGGMLNTAIAGGGVTSAILSGLTSSTQYQSRMRHDCGVLISPWKYRGFITSALRKGEMELSVYPNPAQSILYLSIPGIANAIEADVLIEISDMLGRIVLQQDGLVNGESAVEMDVSMLASGQYAVQVTSDSTDLRELILIQR